MASADTADQHPSSLQQLSDFTTGLDAILAYCHQLLQSAAPNSNASSYTPTIHKTQRYFDESLSPIATELQAVVQSLQQSLQANQQVQQQADSHNQHAAHQLLLAQYNVTHRATAELCIPRQPTPVRRIRLRQLKDNELNKALRPKASYEYSGKVNLDQLKDIGYESTQVHRPPPSPSSIVAPVLSRDDFGLSNDAPAAVEFDRRISLNTDSMRARTHTRQNSSSVNSPALPSEPLSLMNLQGRHRRDLSGSISSPSSGVTQLVSPVNVTSLQRRATLGSQALQQSSPINQQPPQPAPAPEPSRRATMSVMESGNLDSKPKPPSRPLPPELPPIPAAARSPPVAQRQVTPPSIPSFQQPEPQRRVSAAPPPPPPPMPTTAPPPVHVAAALPPPAMPMSQSQHAPPPPPPAFTPPQAFPNAPPPPPPSYSAPPPPPTSAPPPPPPSSAPPPPSMSALSASKATAKRAAGPGDRKDLLASIQAGKGLKKVQRPTEHNALAGKVV